MKKINFKERIFGTGKAEKTPKKGDGGKKVFAGMLFAAACFIAIFVLLEFHKIYWVVGLACALLMGSAFWFLDSMFGDKDDMFDELTKAEEELERAREEDRQKAEDEFKKKIEEQVASLDRTSRAMFAAMKRSADVQENHLSQMQIKIDKVIIDQNAGVRTMIKFNKENARQMALSEKATLEEIATRLPAAGGRSVVMAPDVPDDYVPEDEEEEYYYEDEEEAAEDVTGAAEEETADEVAIVDEPVFEEAAEVTEVADEAAVEDVLSDMPAFEESVIEDVAGEEAVAEETAADEAAIDLESLLADIPDIGNDAEGEVVAEEEAVIVADEPVAEEPVIEEVAAEEPVAEEVAVEEPAVEENAAEDVTVEEAVTEEPVAEEVVAEEPVSEEPAGEENAAADSDNALDDLLAEFNNDVPNEEIPDNDSNVFADLMGDLNAEEAPVEEQLAEEAAAAEPPVEEAPAEEAPVETQPVEETPAEPEPQPAPEEPKDLTSSLASTGVDLSNPNANLSAEDIAKLFAAVNN